LIIYWKLGHSQEGAFVHCRKQRRLTANKKERFAAPRISCPIVIGDMLDLKMTKKLIFRFVMQTHTLFIAPKAPTGIRVH
jgi:hypothetical protein